MRGNCFAISAGAAGNKSALCAFCYALHNNIAHDGSTVANTLYKRHRTVYMVFAILKRESIRIYGVSCEGCK